MAKLKSLKPRLSAIGPRLAGFTPVDRHEAEALRLRQRDKDQPWRKWYYSARWKALRKEVWVRDNYTCRQTCVICVGQYPAGNSPVADHIKPHHGDPDLFWDIENIQTVSKSYHDSLKQRGERAIGW